MRQHDGLAQSQNFLRSPQLAAKLVGLANIDTADTVVEIGPGRGIFTEQLAQRAHQVIGVEIDQALASSLRRTFAGRANVQIATADFLEWSLPASSYTIFANIPFNRTAEILQRLLRAVNPPS